MSKKLFITIVIILILTFGGILGYVYFNGGAGGLIGTPGKPADSFQPSFGLPATSSPTTTTNGQSATSTQPTTTIPRIPALRQLSDTPVAGAIASSTATSTIVWYMDRGVGHIYQTQSDTLGKQLVSNTRIPRVYNVLWSFAQNQIIAQYDQSGDGEISNFYGYILPVKTATSSITSTSTNTTTSASPYFVRGYSTQGDTIDTILSPKGDKLFTLVKESTQTVGYISNIDGSKKTLVWTDPLSEWIASWPTENMLTFTTKATSMGPGYMYTLNLKTGAFDKKLGGIRGLTTLTNTKGTSVLYSVVTGPRLSMKIGNLVDGSSRDANIGTLPEKCIWSTLNPMDAYCAVPTILGTTDLPDAWYQGTTSFSDEIWHINTETGEVHLLGNLLKISGKIIDAYKPLLDKKEHYLIFTNKRDLSLWSIDLTTNN